MGDIQLACILPTAGKVDNGYNYRPHEQPASHLDILEDRLLYATLHRGCLIIGMAETLWVGKTEEPHFLLGLQEHTTGCVPGFLPGKPAIS